MSLTADDFRSLADQFRGLARSIVNFETNNPGMSDADFHDIDRLRTIALDYSDHFQVNAIQQTLKDVQVPLSQISSATTKMNGILKDLKNIAKGISIATAGIQLGAAIMTGQLPAIGKAAENLVSTINN